MYKTNYIPTNKHFEKLLRRWAIWKKAEEKATTIKSEINQYISFLYQSEGYSAAQIGELLGLTRQRISVIIKGVEEREGGVNK